MAHQHAAGLAELRAARSESRKLYWAVGVFSFFANLLMLTGPIYMLNVYDRVLGSRSIETLIALSAIVAFLYGMMGLMDYVRGRVMGRAGARFQSRLDKRVFDAVMQMASRGAAPARNTGLNNLEAVQRVMTSPVLMALFDMPWTPLFLAGIFIFHPWLGMLALGGGVLLILVTLINQWTTRRPVTESNSKSARATHIARQLSDDAEMVQAMGMTKAAYTRWMGARQEALSATISSSDLTGTFTAMTKSLRLFLQSAMLGLGAYLVLQNELTAGAMIAGSILLGRALAPVEQAIGQWAMVQRGQQGWASLAELLTVVPVAQPRTALPRPDAVLDVQEATIIPPGQKAAALRMISFTVKPGQAVGVIGPSGAGKTTLARALTGVWPPAGGKIRLGGAALDQYEPEVLGQHIGYLPQRVQLFDGTIKDNIARMMMNADDAQVVAAAKSAAAHEMIVGLPDGYDTIVTAGGGLLSGGQIQRIGLARALFGDPVVVILDEPNSNLDNEGSMALNAAIKTLKAEGRAVLVMAHRPAAIQECDTVLMIEGGLKKAFGPKDEVLGKVVANAKALAQKSKGGVT
ncbi:MAG: type I secretion system permease/ATPase [Paracoccaceae bacterium]|jgi:PrtD family type I secretion system ABC transporter|nr:type I secretion system permease/ATPase [Paracoccaceae bacterium]